MFKLSVWFAVLFLHPILIFVRVIFYFPNKETNEPFQAILEIIFSTGWDAYWLQTFEGLSLPTFAARLSPALQLIHQCPPYGVNSRPMSLKGYLILLMSYSKFSWKSTTLPMLLIDFNLLDWFQFIYWVCTV